MRVELFGDQVERLSAFSAFTQRSLRDLDEVEIHPAAETPGARAGWGVEDGDEIPRDLESLVPELERQAGLMAWNPEQLTAELAEAEAEAAERVRDPERRRLAYLAAGPVEGLIERATALEEMPLGQPFSFDAQPPALASFGVAEAENELRALVRAGYRVLVAFPHVGEAERTRLAARRVDVQTPAPGERPRTSRASPS